MNGREYSTCEASKADFKQPKTNNDEAIGEARRFMIQWSDLAAAATILPNLEDEGRNLIEQYLGYLPSNKIILPYEPYIRGLLHNYRTGQMADDEFHMQVTDHVKLVRNADMQHNLSITYESGIYQNYDETYIPYGYAVKSRLTKFLGYEPKLAHSLIAEMWLRDVMARDALKLTDAITEVDYKAITLIKYREALLEQCQSAADASPLLGGCNSIRQH